LSIGLWRLSPRFDLILKIEEKLHFAYGQLFTAEQEGESLLRKIEI